MANLKETRIRIKGIKSTQKITKAMKMVATAKLKKIRESLVVLKEYTAEIEFLISKTLKSLSDEEVKSISTHPLVRRNTEGNAPHLIIFNTSNKGLCGAINSYNIKHLKAKVASLEARGHKILIYSIGKKGFDYCQNHYPEYLYNKSPIILEEKQGFVLDAIKDEVVGLITASNASSSSIIFSQFINTATQKTTEVSLTPIHSIKTSGEQHESEYLFDAPKMEIMLKLIPEFMLCKILLSVLENATSEQSARMIAMENASNNAGKAIKNLTLIYNRIRQANITREISEIVAGVESLKQV